MKSPSDVPVEFRPLVDAALTALGLIVRASVDSAPSQEDDSLGPISAEQGMELFSVLGNPLRDYLDCLPESLMEVALMASGAHLAKKALDMTDDAETIPVDAEPSAPESVDVTTEEDLPF